MQRYVTSHIWLNTSSQPCRGKAKIGVCQDNRYRLFSSEASFSIFEVIFSCELIYITLDVVSPSVVHYYNLGSLTIGR